MHGNPLLALACLVAVSCSHAAAQELDLAPITERHVMVPMRDGQKLSAYLYLPPGSGPWPAVFEQRYADLRAAGTRRAAAKLAAAGYVVALVNFRGTHLSEGTWVGYRALGWGELQDGYDTCEWLAKQPWCTGGVGTFGSSQGGYAQNFLAVTQPPHLKCQYMVDTGLSLFQEGYRIGGVTRPKRFLAMDANCRNPGDNRRLLEEWFRHPHYDDYWKQEDCTLHFDRMNVPCFTVGSWYDFMNQGSIASFQGRQRHGGPNSRGHQQLVIGPWLHGRLNKGSRVGDLVYPENATFPEYDHMVRWFDHWLKDQENGVQREPAVRYYVMGAVAEAAAPGNFWRTADTFPPPSTATPYYLQPGGGLSVVAPVADQGSTRYVSDPLHPMEIPGTGFPGAKDARPFEKQAEVRTFTTEPLQQPIEWTGRVRADLLVSSTARDTDFLVRISDVYPDGRSILICDYPQRARYREGFDHEALLAPGQVHKLTYDIGWLSQVFNRGHRIRVTIASTGAPLYEPNPQTGGPQTLEFPKDAVQAENTVHHNRLHASRIIAPVAAISSAVGAVKQPALRYVESSPATGSSAAVIVDDCPLVHTAQLLPLDEKGQVNQPGNAAIQLTQLWRQLDSALRAAGSDADRVTRLHFYLAREEVGEIVRKELSARLLSEQRPAVSFVVTALPHPDALVALDAVAATSDASAAGGVQRLAHAAVMPAGSRLYVSGQAERAGTLREATRQTLASLSATLEHCGRSNNDVVQLKCFLQPMQSVGEAQDEIARHFGGGHPPPVSFVAWRSAAPSIEIELVAWGGPVNTDAKELLEFITPPGLTPSPLFSRVVRIHRGGTIFIGEQFGAANSSAEEQTQQPFAMLSKLLIKTGSDLAHLAKATYYVTDDDVSKEHNAVRPKYYDPARPPAASKALVVATGHPGSRYSMDLLAVPSSRGTPMSGPEFGAGISADEAAAGWISLFDGATTFGWKDAAVDNGLLRGGGTTTAFGKCQVRGEFAGHGTLTIGGQELTVGADKPLALPATSGRGEIRLGPGVAVKSLAVRPLQLQPLFNGSDLSGWKTVTRQGLADGPSPFWRSEEGTLRAVGGPGAIEYGGQLFDNFVLQIDARSRSVHSNGGVFLRSIPGQFMNGYEAQLHNRCLEDDPSKPFRYTTGGIDDRQDARRLVSRDFEFFRMTVIADGPHLATWVNGVQVTDWTDDRAADDNPRQGQRVRAGAIQLQAHDPATDYEVRQIIVSPLK